MAGLLMSLLEKGIPILTIVNTMVKTSIMNGYHTVDTGFLVTPIIVEIIKTIADFSTQYITIFNDNDTGSAQTSSISDIKIYTKNNNEHQRNQTKSKQSTNYQG